MGTSENEKRNVLLAVLAHPDDETFGMGGTLALYARRGADVYLACATRGEAGMMDEDLLGGYASIAEKREAELRCAAEKLGLKDVFFLGYRDSGMPGAPENEHPQALINQPVERVAGEVVRYIRQLRPDAVLTFDPIGGYRHPDHIAVHKATVYAFERAADASFRPEAGPPFQPRYLYFHVFPRWFLRLVVTVMPLLGRDPRRWGRNGDINLKTIAEVRFPTHVRIDIRPVSGIKRAAGACHASQGGGETMQRGLIGLARRLFGEYEAFMQAYPPVKGRVRVRRDLFEPAR